MARFKKYDYKQGQFIAVNFEDQIIPGTFAYTLNYLIEKKLDLSIFEDRFKNNKTGAPAYDPGLLLKVILFAYSLGIVTSRKIALCCEVNIQFMALSGNAKPHFTTIASFISKLSDEISALFSNIILICSEEGLIGKNMFAIDGCKPSSNESKEWSGTREDFIRKKSKIDKTIKYIIEKHKSHDKENPLPLDVQKKEEKALENLSSKADKIQKWLDENDDKKGISGNAIKSNITDNESAKMVSAQGVKQGYNGIALSDEKHQVVVNAEAFAHQQNILS